MIEFAQFTPEPNDLNGRNQGAVDEREVIPNGESIETEALPQGGYTAPIVDVEPVIVEELSTSGTFFDGLQEGAFISGVILPTLLMVVLTAFLYQWIGRLVCRIFSKTSVLRGASDDDGWILIRIDKDIADQYRLSGAGWRNKINQVLSEEISKQL